MPTAGETLGPWEPTGATRHRRSLFGKLILQEQVARMEFAPIVTGHTPDNWRQRNKWRDAR
jgi:hypothetical protein